MSERKERIATLAAELRAMLEELVPGRRRGRPLLEDAKPNSLRLRAHRARLAAVGICGLCCSRPARAGRKICDDCTEKNRHYQAAYRSKKAATS